MSLFSLSAVPLTLRYQGHIKVDGQPFDGSGQFKFVVIADGAAVWTHDGTGSAAVAPDSHLAVTVSRGIYSIGLGDTNVAGMTTIPATVFTNNALTLRVWFNDGVNGFEQLAPDQSIGSVAFAVRAQTAATVESIPAGLIQEEHLPTGFLNLVNSMSSALNTLSNQVTSLSQGAVSSSTVSGDTNLLAVGYREFSSVPATEWRNGPEQNEPGARRNPAGVWTGGEFIVWGGDGLAGPLNNGGIYNPTTDAWAAVSPIDAPAARSGHVAVWSGSELIVWGGIGSAGWLSDGGRFQLATSQWRPISANGAPAERSDAISAWVNGRLVVWGGRNAAGILGDGALYDPVADAWTALPTTGQPEARMGASAVINGTTLIVWGGEGVSGELNSGAVLDLSNVAAPTWTAISTTGAASVRSAHGAVWSGTQMLVWGGQAGGAFLADGAAYDPSTDSWTGIAAGAGSPSARGGHSALWTGSELLIFFGETAAGAASNGAAYDPATGVWRALTNGGSPVARTGAAAVWSGTEAMFLGGSAGNLPVASLQRLNPEPTLYLYRKQ